MSAPLVEKTPPANWILQHPAVSGPELGVTWPWRLAESANGGLTVFQYRQMEALEPADRAQLHAAFLVYMDLTEGDVMEPWYVSLDRKVA